MSELQCQVEIPEVKGLESQKLTVGRTFYYQCRGDWPVGLQVESLQLQYSAEDATAYDLRLLSFEFRDPNTADLLLVSYRPGVHNLKDLKLTDGTNSVSLTPIQLEVHSVLNPAEKTEMYGPMGPMTIPIPWVYWIILISVLGIAISVGALVWRRRHRRRQLMAEIQQRTTHPSPLVQFHRELRLLTKKAGLHEVDRPMRINQRDFLKDLREICEIFWGQKFQVAVLHQNSSRIRPEFKRHAPKIYIKFRKEIRFWDRRWNSLYFASEGMTIHDLAEFVHSTRELIEKMAEDQE